LKCARKCARSFLIGHRVMNVRRSARSTGCLQLWAVRALLG
jgi:hypothetical protein